MASARGRSTSAIVVGSGPNGLAAAITLARAGLSVTVLEAENTIGGGSRSAELTLPGFTNDVCSAIHPMGIASPFFNSLPLAEHGLTWIHPTIPLAHPLDDGSASILQRSLDATAASLARTVEHIGASSLHSSTSATRCWMRCSCHSFRRGTRSRWRGSG